eukprot:augustus_masked-scaffold_7-processed-gene-5.14-mRNA-1 protein AED:0.03 eAED:0.03 QI:0/-1/0/1/-1/1/1/0/376
MSRATVSVFSASKPEEIVSSVEFPDVMRSPIRPDLIDIVHSQISNNRRQAYATKKGAGMDTAAESWGTGRAVSRIPRVPGGGTHRAGQGAFGNMCRGGRQFAPHKIWRKWHRATPLGARRYAVASAVAASAVPALVIARGHRVSQVPELPLVLSNNVSEFKKTKEAVALLSGLGLDEEVERVNTSRKIRTGKGKSRNRRYVQKKGILLITSLDEDRSFEKTFSNLRAVDIARVENISILDLAPGGHIGRLILWTETAFNKLNTIFGTRDTPSEVKKGFVLPRACIENADVTRIINSDTVQKEVRPIRTNEEKVQKLNPLKHKEVMDDLNPYAEELRKRALELQNMSPEERKKVKKAKKEGKTSKKERKAFLEKMLS